MHNNVQRKLPQWNVTFFLIRLFRAASRFCASLLCACHDRSTNHNHICPIFLLVLSHNVFT